MNPVNPRFPPPTPSLVKTPEFPAVALDDVWRARVALNDAFPFAGDDMTRPAMRADALDGAAAETFAALATPRQAAIIRGACALARFDAAGAPVEHAAARRHLAADIAIARDWKPGALQDDGKRSDSEQGFRE